MAFVIFYSVVVGVVYIYQLKRLILNVLVKERADLTVSSLSSDVSKLESEYIKIKNGLDVSRAEALGLSEDLKRTYFANVVSGPTTVGLSK